MSQELYDFFLQLNILVKCAKEEKRINTNIFNSLHALMRIRESNECTRKPIVYFWITKTDLDLSVHKNRPKDSVPSVMEIIGYVGSSIHQEQRLVEHSTIMSSLTDQKHLAGTNSDKKLWRLAIRLYSFRWMYWLKI